MLFVLLLQSILSITIEYNDDQTEATISGRCNVVSMSSFLKKAKQNDLKLLRFEEATGLECIDSIECLKTLTNLEFYDTDLKTFPAVIYGLENIKFLTINGSQIEELPDGIAALKNLKGLGLTNNTKLKRLPEDIGNLQNLNTLFICKSEIEELPVSVGNLDCLETLTIRNSKLRVLPNSLGNLKKLEELNVPCNKLECVPSSICDNIGLKLTEIDVSGNYIPENANCGTSELEKLREHFRKIGMYRYICFSSQNYE